jgi:hypothetical protein
MFCRKFCGSGVPSLAKDDFKKFANMVEEFARKQIEVVDIKPKESETVFYYKLVDRKPNYEPLSKAHDLLVSINESLKRGELIGLKVEVEKATALVKEAMYDFN